MAAGSAKIGPMPSERGQKDTTEPMCDGEVDISLLQSSLAITPWERMRANDDALNFAESLRAAMLKRNAKPQ